MAKRLKLADETIDDSTVEVPEPRPIRLRMVKIDGDTQTREEIDDRAVEEYAEAMKAGAVLPPIEVVYDGRSFWLVDGFHRFHAAQRAGLASLPAITHQGTREHARWLACAANRTHGLRRSNADKRRAVMLALELRPEESDRAIAEHCGVSHPFVGSVRNSSGEEVGPDETEREGPGGYDDAPEAEQPSKAATNRVQRVERDEPEPEPEPAVEMDPCEVRMERATEAIKEGVALIDETLKYFRDLDKHPEGAWLHLQAIESDLVNARAGAKKAAPAGRCAKCKGKGCKACRKTGWVSKLTAETNPEGVLVA